MCSTFCVWDEFFLQFCRGPQFGPKLAGDAFSRGDLFGVFFSISNSTVSAGSLSNIAMAGKWTDPLIDLSDVFQIS